MSDEEVSDEEIEMEGEGSLVKINPLGEFSGCRNDKMERHGRGRSLLPNGDLYLGCYYRGKRHGLGIYRYKNGNGARYGGDWVLGDKQGWGSMYYPDGSQYTGNWDRNERHGWGVYVFPNQDEYEGWWYRGKRNGRGIYRTKKTGEKFVGEWILGKRQGSGMIIRANHTFLGYFYNDIPKGDGVYIFPDLKCEQRGRYTHMKLLPGSEEKWTVSGYQVRLMRSAPPPADPLLLEREVAANSLLPSSEMPGEGYCGEAAGDAPEPELLPEGPSNDEDASADAEPPKPRMKRGVTKVTFGSCIPGDSAPPVYTEKGTSGAEKTTEEADAEHAKHGIMKNPLPEAAQQLYEYMKSVISAEVEADLVQIPIVPMWRVTGVTGIQTLIPDGTVPPPPMPLTPVPPLDPIPDVEAEATAVTVDLCNEDAVSKSRRLAASHRLGPAYLGQGVCQPSEIDLRENCLPYSRFSKLSMSDLEATRAALDATGNQLGVLDVEAAMKEALLNPRKTDALGDTGRWRDTLEADEKCGQPGEVKAPVSAPPPPPPVLEVLLPPPELSEAEDTEEFTDYEEIEEEMLEMETEEEAPPA